MGQADRVSTPRSPSRSRSLHLAGAGAAVGSVVAVAVPIVQGVVVWRTARPAVPGPHVLDGLVGRTGDDALEQPVGADRADPVPLVWLGDSLACGVGAASADAALPRKAAALWCQSDGRSMRLTCLARPGARSEDVLGEQVPAALSLLDARAVVVATVGANDVGSLTHPGRYRRNLAAILDALVATGATVVAVGLPDMGSAAVMRRPLRTLAGWAGRYADRQVRRLAGAHGAHYVHIAVRPSRGRQPHEYLAADRWHPNDHTYHLWAERVASLLTPLLAVPAVAAV